MTIFHLADYRTKHDPLAELDDLLAITYPQALEWALRRIPARLMEVRHLPGEDDAAYAAREAEAQLEFTKHLTTWMDHHGLSVADLRDEIDACTPGARTLRPTRDIGRLTWTMLHLDPALLVPLADDADDPAEIARQEALADILDEMALELRDEASLEVAA